MHYSLIQVVSCVVMLIIKELLGASIDGTADEV